jgi:hypothetical protein
MPKRGLIGGLHLVISVRRGFEESVAYMSDFLESIVIFGILLYGWLSMNNFKDNFKNNYLFFKPNYFFSFLMTTFFSYEFFLITISHLF